MGLSDVATVGIGRAGALAKRSREGSFGQPPTSGGPVVGAVVGATWSQGSILPLAAGRAWDRFLGDDTRWVGRGCGGCGRTEGPAAELVFERASQRSEFFGCDGGIGSDPAVGDIADGQGVEVVPALATAAHGDH